jgi:uncharacterized protein YjiS (DUF1127 family)
MYCATSDAAIDLPVFEGTMMSKTWDSRTLTTLSRERTPLATLSRLASFLTLWRKRLRCRRELSTLTAEQMRDTGLDPELVRRESRKPFWKA